MEKTTQLSTTASKPQRLYTALNVTKAKKMANELTKFLEQNKLVYHIAGHKYVPVEGWQFVGETQMGLTTVVVSCDPVQTDGKEIKYKSVVEVLNQQGTVLSRGFAFCSSAEKKKRGFEEYAVASMAQTRAIGKAYRNILSWIVKMGGYEATPYEEVDRDLMEADLAKIKADVFAAFKEKGITDSQEMIDLIEKATGKVTIENAEDAMSVLAEMDKDETSEDA